MSNKIVTYGVLVLAGLVIIGSLVYAICDVGKNNVRMAEYKETTQRMRRKQAALEAAQAAARELIRARLAKQEKKEAREKGAEVVRRQKETARRRREATFRLFFSGGDLKLSASYLKACAMPEGDPSEEDQEIIDLADELLTEEDLDTAAEVAEAAKNSADPRVRMAAVEMLSAMGEAGLADIGEFLGDSHPEVANLAAERWELGVQDVVDDEERTALVKVGLLAITDEDQLRSMVGTLLLTTDELLVLQTVADVMRDGAKVQRDAVKEAYENVTGEPWKNEKAAEAWLEANYTPSEPDDSEAEDEPQDDEVPAEDS